MSFKDNLKIELDFQGVLVKELAAKTGISRRTLDTYLNSRAVSPSIDNAILIAQALNVSVEFLATGKERDAPHRMERCPRCTQFADILDDLQLVPPDVALPLKTAIKAFADIERKKKEQRAVSS